MFFPEGQVRVHVYGRPVDLRKSYDGLYALTRQELGQDPLNGPQFVFINRRADQTTFDIPIEFCRDRIPLAPAPRSTGAAVPPYWTWRL
jgi:hypothetical protein